MTKEQTILFGIGAQKAGTSWLHHQLSQHPEIHFSLKEVHYWDTVRGPQPAPFRIRSDLEAEALKRRFRLRQSLGLMSEGQRRKVAVKTSWAKLLRPIEQDSDHYKEFLAAGSEGKKIIGDITPLYALLSSSTFSEMAELADDVRFIFIMRDPVDRIISGIRHFSRRVDLTEADVYDHLDRLIKDILADDHNVNLLRSRYETTLKALDRAVAPDRLLVLFYEDLFSEQTRIAVQDFLGLQSELPWETERRQNPAKGASFSGSDAQRRDLRERLDPTYRYVRERFGDAVPQRWLA
ncbi:MAG: sulfotransferase [Pseudomonadota bacterium]